MSLFSDALRTIISEVHRAQGSPSVLYGPGGATPGTAIKAVFDADFQAVDLETGVLASVGPAVGVRLTDLPTETPRVNDSVQVDGVDYLVREIQRETHGGALLLLRKVT